MSFILMSLANDYTARFILTYGIMVILAFTLLVKVVLGLIYTLKYKCTNKNKPKNDVPFDNLSHINDYFQGIKKSLYV